MSTFISFVKDGDGESMFSALVEAVPRIGEAVRYEHSAMDEELWNIESWDHSKSMSAAPGWIVTSVMHSYRRMSVQNPPSVTIIVSLRDMTPAEIALDECRSG